MSNHSSCWSLARSEIRIDGQPAVMAIVNVTPDSFSDGGNYLDHERAVVHALQLVRDGADILDIGGESTRPYSTPVDEAEERNRVIPVIQQLARETDVPISIDTSNAAVARAAIEAGAQIINDVTGLEGDPEMLNVAVESGAGVCAMHMQGNPQSMQDDPSYDNVVEDIFGYLKERKAKLTDGGISRERICLDPGIGFGKTHQHNWELLRHIERFHELGCPILVGHSRKGFIAKALGDKQVERDSGTLAITLHLAQRGVQIIRVHEVAQTCRALRVQAALFENSVSAKTNAS